MPTGFHPFFHVEMIQNYMETTQKFKRKGLGLAAAENDSENKIPATAQKQTRRCAPTKPHSRQPRQ